MFSWLYSKPDLIQAANLSMTPRNSGLVNWNREVQGANLNQYPDLVVRLDEDLMSDPDLDVTNVTQVKASKLLFIERLQIIVEAMNRKARVSYTHFQPLFDAVDKAGIMNIHANPNLDTFFINMIDSKKEALNVVSKAAQAKIEDYIRKKIHAIALASNAASESIKQLEDLYSEFRRAIYSPIFNVPLCKYKWSSFFESECFSELLPLGEEIRSAIQHAQGDGTPRPSSTRLRTESPIFRPV